MAQMQQAGDNDRDVPVTGGGPAGAPREAYS